LASNGWHIFICFSSTDEAFALRIADFLEGNGVACWISVRDVLPGQNYQESIVEALEAAKGVVFLFSAASSKSGEIKKELSLAAGLGMQVFPLRLEPVTPSGALRYELATRQWIDVFQNQEQALDKLLKTIRSVLNAPGPAAIAGKAGQPAASTTSPSPSSTEAWARPTAPIVAAGSPQFEAIRALLARHIGPIAKLVVQNAATGARTPEDFCERLAAHVSGPADRAAFLRAARAQLAGKS
jgi:hypothetical protein